MTSDQVRMRLMQLHRIYDRTRFEYIERLSIDRQYQILRLRGVLKKHIKKLDPAFGTPYYGFNPAAYLDWMKKRWESL